MTKLAWRTVLGFLALTATDALAQARGDLVKTPLGSAQVVVAVGKPAGGNGAVFEYLQTAVLDPLGRVYVLDRGTRTIRQFDAAGSELGAVGRGSIDEGGLVDPLSMAHDGRQTLYVADTRAGLVVYSTEAGLPKFRARYSSDLGARAVCVLGDEIVLVGTHGGSIVHVLDAQGRRVRDFGAPFHADTVKAMRVMSERWPLTVGCDAKAGRIIVAEGASDRVRSYNASGTLLWERQLPDYHRTRLERERDGTAAVTIYGDFTTLTVRSGEGDRILLQAHHVERARERGPGGGTAFKFTDHGAVNFVLSGSNGTVLGRTTGGDFVSYWDAARAVLFNDQPFPRVVVGVVRPESAKPTPNANR